MEEECAKNLFNNPIKIEILQSCVIKILTKVEMFDMNRKIILRYNHRKVGYLLSRVPIEEIKILRYWISPFGIKTELSYKDKFIGVLLINK